MNMLTDPKLLEQQAQELIKIANGAAGEMRKRDGGIHWVSFRLRDDVVDLDDWEYRTKPEKKRVPWDQSYVRGTTIIRFKDTPDFWNTIIGANKDGVVLGDAKGNIFFTYEHLMNHAESSLNGENWLPCSKEVEA
jgi:hypothetical protein